VTHADSSRSFTGCSTWPEIHLLPPKPLTRRTGTFPGNMVNDFDAAAQALFSTSNVLGLMQTLDQDWATATASS
jgi:hypothetical protein